MKALNSRQRQALATKKKILETAHALLTDKSYEDLTMSQIASAAGVSVGTLYHHFDSKESLFFFGYHYFDLMIEAKRAQIHFASHIEALRSVIYAQTIGAFKRGVNYMATILRIQLSSHSSLFLNDQRAFPQYIRLQVGQAIAAGEILPSCDADLLSSAILRIARGCIFDSAVRNTPEMVGQNVVHDLDILLKNHLPDPATVFPPPNPLWLDTYHEWMVSADDWALM